MACLININQGLLQKDFYKCSPVIKSTTIHIVLTIALSQNWKLRKLDVNNVVLSGELSEDVFTLQPHGFKVSTSNMVCKLKKTFYELKQAPRLWYNKLNSSLYSLKFQNAKTNMSLFFQGMS